MHKAVEKPTGLSSRNIVDGLTGHSKKDPVLADSGSTGGTRACITLRGSANIVVEFFGEYYWFILYYLGCLQFTNGILLVNYRVQH